jgi:acylphosphatase
VRGRVQGVGYRAWTADAARSLGLAGYVRNRRDGSVEALLSGPAETVEAMLAGMRRGPPLARVDELTTRDDHAEAPAAFEVRATD